MNYDQFASQTCFFISDDISDQKEFAQALCDSMPGTACIAIDDIDDALFLMHEQNIIPNFIFVELYMPGTNGLDFLKELKKTKRLRNIPVIVHTTAPDDERIVELKNLGVLAICMKPYDYYGLRVILNLYFTKRIVVASQN